MSTFKERLITEEKELDIKLKDLQQFLTKQDYEQTVSDYQLHLLRDQEYHMRECGMTLRARIEDLKESE